MDLTEIFERLFTGKHFTSDADFDKACGTFRKVCNAFLFSLNHSRKPVAASLVGT